jgi:predicted ABC-type ATPase
MLAEITRLTTAHEDFAFESTLSGLNHAKRVKRMRLDGYDIEMIFLRLRSPQLALRRIAARVRHGGHNVAKEDVLRRFVRGLANFEAVYKPLAHSWAVYDNSGRAPLLIESGP